MSRHRPPDEGIFRAAVTRSGLSVVFRSRALSALDRLLGALVGIPAAWLEAVESRIRNRASRESFVQDAAATRLGTAILEDGEVARRSVADLALSSRVLSTSRKVCSSDLVSNDALPKSTDRKVLAPDVQGEDVDRDAVATSALKPRSSNSRSLEDSRGIRGLGD